MFKMKNLLLIIILILTSKGFAQNNEWKGIVLEMNSTPVEGATIVLYDLEGNLLKYDLTDEHGGFYIQTDIKIGYTLKVTHLAFMEKSIMVTNNMLSDKEINSTIIVEPNNQQLDEILLVDKNTERDTTSFDLAKLNLKDNDNLKSILEKIPSFQVGDNGSIIYKGKNIDKILINNNPTFINQNTIALKSVERRLIEGIEVINNFQDNFELDFDEVEESVLNININKDYNNILNGSITGKSGYKNKYQLQGRGMYFSETLNAFLTHNSNNFGETDIQAREVKQLFHKDQPFSIYQISTINELFSNDENLKESFLSNSNLTLRKQNSKIKASGLIQFIHPERNKITSQSLASIDNSKILETEDQTEYKSPSFFAATTVALKLGKKTIITHDFRTNFTNSKKNRFAENNIYKEDTINNKVQTSSFNKSEITSLFNKISIASKLEKNLILRGSIVYSKENDNLKNSFYTQSNNSENNSQEINFSQRFWKANSELRYQFSQYFIPSISYTYSNDDKKINTIDLQHLERTINTSTLNLKINGDDLFENLNYDFELGIQHKSSDNNEIINNYIPIDLYLDYDNRLKSYSISYNRNRSLNFLESGLDLIKPFNIILLGDPLNISKFSNSENIRLIYSHNNLFDGIVYNLTAEFTKETNKLSQGYIRQEGTTTYLDYFIAPFNKKYSLSGYFSKTILPLSYPTKVDLSLDYTNNNFITKFDATLQNGTSTYYTPKITIRSITDNLLNFELGTKMSFQNDNISNQEIESKTFSGHFLMNLDLKNWDADLIYQYDTNTINKINFSRHNINMNASYQWNKLKFSVEGRHLGELFNLWNNTAYNSTFYIQNGLRSTITENQSLNFLIVGIEYNL